MIENVIDFWGSNSYSQTITSRCYQKSLASFTIPYIEDRAIHFEDIAYGQGASMALPIWGIYMKSVYQDSTLIISNESFDRPKKLTIELDCNKFVIDSIGSGKTTDQEILDIDF